MLQILVVDFTKRMTANDFEANYEMTGEVLADETVLFDLFARDLKIEPLSHFVGTVEADFDAYKVASDDETWLLPSDALKTVNELLTFLQRSPIVATTKAVARQLRNFQKSGLLQPAVEELHELRELLASIENQSETARFKFVSLVY